MLHPIILGPLYMDSLSTLSCTRTAPHVIQDGVMITTPHVDNIIQQLHAFKVIPLVGQLME